MAMAAPAQTKKILKLALGTRLQAGPFGGGNQFAQTLTEYLKKQGHQVNHNLNNTNIDVIILTEPRPWSRSSAFDITAALKYRQSHPNVKIIHRINECDERKDKPFSLHNRLLQATARQADVVVFVSRWLQNLHLKQAPDLAGKSYIIKSGADPTIFNPRGQAIWNGQEKLRIVTHHWSANWHKGWDVYQALDTFLNKNPAAPFTFTFIGNPWPQATLRATKVIPPLSGEPLANQLKAHHAYISASQNEPAGMHFIEALQCGLPIAFRQSGSLPEYCAPYGAAFTNKYDAIDALHELRKNHSAFAQKLENHTYSAFDMCAQYENLCFSLLTPTHYPLLTTHSSILYLRVQQIMLFIRDSLL